MRIIIVMFKDKDSIRVQLPKEIINYQGIDAFADIYFPDRIGWGEANFHFKKENDPTDKE